MKKYLVFYRKKGYFIYISSLDTAQTITRALRRASIPFSYTEGFNPHPKISFPPSLSLGFAGDREFFEIELRKSLEENEFKIRINKELPTGLKVVEIKEAPHHIFSQIIAHKFSILAKKEYESENQHTTNYKKIIYDIIESENAKIIKKNKKGKEVVYILREFINNIDILEDSQCILIDVVLNILNGKSLNPKDLTLLLKNHGLDLSSVRIKRSGFFIKKGEKFVKI